MDKRCIFHIEDNEADRRLLAMALNFQAVPLELHTARDGEEASKLLLGIGTGELCSPDLIVLDLNLPKRSGLELLGDIRRNPKLSGARVAVLTSSDHPDDQQRTEALGVDAYFRKPLELEDFLGLGGELLQLIV